MDNDQKTDRPWRCESCGATFADVRSASMRVCRVHGAHLLTWAGEPQTLLQQAALAVTEAAGVIEDFRGARLSFADARVRLMLDEPPTFNPDDHTRAGQADGGAS